MTSSGHRKIRALKFQLTTIVEDHRRKFDDRWRPRSSTIGDRRESSMIVNARRWSSTIVDDRRRSPTIFDDRRGTSTIVLLRARVTVPCTQSVLQKIVADFNQSAFLLKKINAKLWTDVYPSRIAPFLMIQYAFWSSWPDLSFETCLLYTSPSPRD